MAKYTFKEFGYCQLSVNHIPYLVYSIVEGPRGGQYMLDEFNTEVLLKHLVNTINPTIVAFQKHKVIKNMTKNAIVKTIYSSYSNDTLKMLAAQNNQKFLHRQEGIPVIEKMTKAFDEYQVDYLKKLYTNYE